MSLKDRWQALTGAMDNINKQHGKGTIMALGDQSTDHVPCIPTGCPSLDRALGCGGYPRGRVVEIFGPEASGKTTLTLHAIAECQKTGGIAAFVDAEHALDVQYAKALGVDPSRLLISQPDSGEQALDVVETLVRSGGVDLVVIDSVAALVPQAEIEGDIGDQQMGLQARLMSKAMRRLSGTTHRTQTTLFFVNQLRTKIGVTWGSPEVTTGGNALKYYASVRIDIRRIGALKSGDQVLGNRTRVKIVKNKVAPPYRKVEFDIRFGEGIDAVGDLLDLAVERGVIAKSGSYYAYGDERLGQGREKARAALLADEPMREAVREAALGEQAVPAADAA